jgi:hypothetical protein
LKLQGVVQAAIPCLAPIAEIVSSLHELGSLRHGVDEGLVPILPASRIQLLHLANTD